MQQIVIKSEILTKFINLYNLCYLVKPTNGNIYTLKNKLYVLDYGEFNSYTIEIHQEIKELNKIAYSTFANNLYDLFKATRIDNDVLDKSKIEVFINNLLKEFPVKVYEIYAPIWGISLPLGKGQVKIGEFVICRKGVKFVHSDEHQHDHSINYFLGVSIEARDDDHVNSLANEKFSIFESAMRVITKLNGDLSSVTTSEKRNQYMLRYRKDQSGNTVKNDITSVKFMNEINLFNEYISNPEFWNIISKPKSDMDKRMNRAINWLGKALNEADGHISFIQYFFTIEALLQKDENFGPSITHRISEITAFLLYEDRIDRLHLYREIKKLYQIRSKIAHGNSIPNILYSQIFNLREICLDLVKYLLINKDQFQTYEKLESHIEELRFG